MPSDPSDKPHSLGEILYGVVPGKTRPAWEPADDPFPASSLFPEMVTSWYKRNFHRAIDELCDPVGITNRLKQEAFANDQKYSAVKQWLVPQLSLLWLEMTEIHDRFPLFSMEWVEALREHGKKWAALCVPDRLTGHIKRRKIPNEQLPALLTRFEQLKAKAAKAARGRDSKFQKLLGAFPELPANLCDPTGRFFPEKFAKRALAHEYGCTVSTIQKALTKARKARQ